MNSKAVLVLALLSCTLGYSTTCNPVIPQSRATSDCASTQLTCAETRSKLQSVASTLRNVSYYLNYVKDNITQELGNGLYASGTNIEDGQRLAESVCFFQCFVPHLADIVRNESLRKFVELNLSDNYYEEFVMVLSNMDVLIEIRDLIRSNRAINNCILPARGCGTLTASRSYSPESSEYRLSFLKTVAQNMRLFIEELEPSVTYFQNRMSQC